MTITSLRNTLIATTLGLCLAACNGGSSNSSSGPIGGGGGAGGNDGGDGDGDQPLIEAPTLSVLSNRADLISGGDALIEVQLPEGIDAGALSISLNGSDVGDQFAERGNGRVMALLSGLTVGSNTLSAHTPGSHVATLSIRNHPNGGPIFSGPQLSHWLCQEGAVDAQCNQAPSYTYLYKSTSPLKTGLQPYDPDNPPDDVADTTTASGDTLPFIVRQETGYQNRDQYTFLTLYRPGEDWQPWAPQSQWNRKLLVTHGGSCGSDRHTSTAPLEDYAGTIPANPAFEQSYILALGRGFAVMSTALANNGHNCNIALQAEAQMMAKERFVEQYGELRYTMGTGCSGGALVQQQLANAYPGIYQGLITTCAYPDTFSAGTQFADYHLLRLYFENPSKWGEAIAWSPTQMAAVEGHLSHVNAVAADEGLFKNAITPTGDCAKTPDGEDDSYHPDTNPSGVRCGLLDAMINVFGPRPQAVWTDIEKELQRGFAGIPIDNAGIQYGLQALRERTITPAQFVSLNATIGGLDVDIQHSAERTRADASALANLYRSGAVNVANRLNGVPIINATGPDPGAAHDAVHTFWARWRLDREHGHHDNHVIWSGPAPLIGDPNFILQAIDAMDRWLSAIEQDSIDATLAEKIVLNKPDDIHDQCSDGVGNVLLDTVCPEAILPIYGTPRTVAGDHNTADTMQCQLKPINRDDDYGPLPFSDAQWATLETVFADGVCDYSKPAVGLQPTLPWLSYQDTAGAVVYGGQPLPAAELAPGWFSPAFQPAP